MKVLYITSSFPKPEKGATIYTDLAEQIHEKGHQIVVAVSEQPKNILKSSLIEERGFLVLRILTGNYFEVSFVRKGITTLLMPMLMRRGIKKYLGHFNFDLILFEAPPVTNSSLIKWAKRHFDCKSYLMLKDIFPQNAVDLGIIKTNSFLYRYFLLKERLLFENTDYIGCMSYANKQYILRNSDYLDPDKVEIFPNTKKITRDYNCVSFPMREMLEIPSTSCVFLFGGNMGRPQYVELLCSAIKHFKDNCNVFFLFVGRGTEKHRIAKTIENYKVDNAIILDDLPREKYEQINKECDVGLIVLDPRFTIPNYPSRILSYMEYAKPVLAATDNVTDIRNLIEEVDCGYWVWSGDEQGFLLAIEDILVDKELVQKGIKGRKYIEEKLKVEHCVQILESHFESNKE